VKRLTDGVTDGRSYVHYYATVNPMSAGDTKILVSRADLIIDLNGNTVVSAGNMPASQGLNVWDRTNDMVFWNVPGDNTVRKCTVSSNSPGTTVSCAVNHTFTEYAGGIVNMMDETDMTPGGWLVMVGQATVGGAMDIFLWNPTTLTKSPVINSNTAVLGNCTQNAGFMNGCIHKLIGTADDGVLIQAPGGQVLWHSPWPANPQVYDQPHSDSGRDLLGNNIHITESGNSGGTCPDGSSFSPAYTIEIDSGWSLADYQCLFANPGSNPGWHVSYRDWPTRAWTVYSAQANHAGPECFNNAACYADPSSSNWGYFENEIVMVRIDANNDPSKIYRLALSHTRGGGTDGNGYFWSDPRAAVSYSGKYVIFDSNAAWGSSGCGSVGSCSDIYLITIH